MAGSSLQDFFSLEISLQYIFSEITHTPSQKSNGRPLNRLFSLSGSILRYSPLSENPEQASFVYFRYLRILGCTRHQPPTQTFLGVPPLHVTKKNVRTSAKNVCVGG